MEKQTVKILKTKMVTHNVKQFTLEKPPGFTFLSGQAADVSINRAGLEDELRPFTFTSLNSDDHLEFTIKTYTDHDGVTKKLLDVGMGEELIIHEVFGAITYKGPGLFIAGGAGITPFISILRQLRKDHQLAGNTLLFANRTENDIILKDELDAMLGRNHIDVISNPMSGAQGSRIDKKMIQRQLTGDNQYGYICGPDDFVADMKDYLLELGMPEDYIVIEA